MEKLSIRCIFFLFFVCATVVSCSNAESSHGEVEDEHEFNYERDGEQGPENWGMLKREWEMCGKGDMQSPIDLSNHRVSAAGKLERSYHPSTATLKNRGHDMMLKFHSGAGYTMTNGTAYELGQMHWHSPSEHTINGKRFDMELHMVHQSKDNKFAVVAILYEIGSPDTFLQSMEKVMKMITDKHQTEENVRSIDPGKVELESTEFYSYIGSLTTPPCTQNVIWTIVTEVRTVSREQLNMLRVAVHDESDSNARPIQPVNKRTVRLYQSANSL